MANIDEIRNIGEKFTFHDLLTLPASRPESEKWQTSMRIAIPKIQRDYAQGRDNEEDVRKGFLDTLFDYMVGESVGTKTELDFIYGKVDKSSSPYVFQPIDGQQRLTTLFLLHLFVGKCAHEDLTFMCYGNHKKSRFSYETRDLSRQFCDRLVSDTVIPLSEWPCVAEYIKKQWWFTGLWKSDPTISSMVTMLHEIELRFGQIKHDKNAMSAVWNNLRDNIEFWFLDLDDLRATDDLYIKMNSRGKELSGFEHFKAMADAYAKKAHKRHSPSAFAHNIDTVWTELFWQYRQASLPRKAHLDFDDDEYMRNGLDEGFKNFFTVFLTIEGAKRGVFSYKEAPTDLLKLAAAVLGQDTTSGHRLCRAVLSRVSSVLDELHTLSATSDGLDGFFGTYITDTWFKWPDTDCDLHIPEQVPVYISGETNIFKSVVNGDMNKKASGSLKRVLYAEAFFEYLVKRSRGKCRPDFLQKLRSIRNLIENTEIHEDEISDMLARVDSITDAFNLDAHSCPDMFNRLQMEQEKEKLTWRENNRSHAPLMDLVENHWLLLGNLHSLKNVLGCDKPDDKGEGYDITVLKNFGLFFNHSHNDYIIAGQALLTKGDYATVNKNSVAAYGGKDWSWWKKMIQNYGRTNVQPINRHVLQSYLRDANGFSLQDLRRQITDKSRQKLAEKRCDRGYYMMTYPGMMGAPQGKYVIENPDAEYDYTMRNKSGERRNDDFWNPFNHTLHTFFPDTTTAGDWGEPIRIIGHDISLDYKEDRLEIGVGDVRYSVRIPQNNGIDMIDRLRLGKIITDKILHLITRPDAQENMENKNEEKQEVMEILETYVRQRNCPSIEKSEVHPADSGLATNLEQNHDE